MDERKKTSIKILVDYSELDAAIEKANRLTELLREASEIIDSLSGKPTNISNFNYGPLECSDAEAEQLIGRIMQHFEDKISSRS